MPKPVSVVVPKSDKSGEWFEFRCLPSIRENDPAEIIVENGQGTELEKRSAGLGKATQPFVLVGREDMVLYEWALGKMAKTLDAIRNVSFVYCDWREVSGKKHTARKAKPWDEKDPEACAVALVRRESLADLDLKDPNGADIWKALASKGRSGLYIGETLLEIHTL
jgi:hypothetical protein